MTHLLYAFPYIPNGEQYLMLLFVTTLDTITAGSATIIANIQINPIITMTILERARSFFNGLTIPVYLSNAKATNVKIDTPIETSLANSLARQITSPISPSHGHASYTNINPAHGTAISITRRSPNANEKMYLWREQEECS